jgi:hypothetical protein
VDIGYLGFGFGMMMIILIPIALVIVPFIFYMLTLQKALERCSPVNRSMSPGMVWLQIIPIFGFIWQFFVVTAISSSLEKEYASRRAPVEPQPGRNLGIAMCVTVLCSAIPYVGWLCGIAYIVLWILYWVKISNLSGTLDRLPLAPGPGFGRGPGGGYYQAPTYQSPSYQQAGYQAAGYAPPSLAASGYAAGAYAQPAESRPTPSIDDTSSWLSSNARSTPAACSACGAALAPDATFCVSCGAQRG